MTDFGGKLRQAREGRGISLRQISAKTKISVAVLEALERNDVSKLPGGIFSRAFVRSYAVEVGLDPDETVREFLQRFQSEPAPEPQLHVPVSDAESALEYRQRAVMIGVKVVVGAVVIAGAAAYFVVKGRRPPQTARVAAKEVIPALQADAVPAQPPPPPVVESTMPSPPAAAPMKLEVHASGPCWVRLVVDDQTILARVMQPGERQVVAIRDAAVIDIGDAGAFAFTVDGRPGKTLGGAGQVRSVRLTRGTLSQHLR